MGGGMPHIQIIPMGGSDSGMMHHFGGLGDFLRSIRKTGPAQEHHMGPILPGSILTPGAHPKHLLNEQKKKEATKKETEIMKDVKQKDEAKKDEAKKENNDKKDEKKADDKPKSEGEAH